MRFCLKPNFRHCSTLLKGGNRECLKKLDYVIQKSNLKKITFRFFEDTLSTMLKWLRLLRDSLCKKQSSIMIISVWIFYQKFCPSMWQTSSLKFSFSVEITFKYTSHTAITCSLNYRTFRNSWNCISPAPISAKPTLPEAFDNYSRISSIPMGNNI